jgi:hypothetical protein
MVKLKKIASLMAAPLIISLLCGVFIGAVGLRSEVAEARIGGGRSMGRGSSPSMRRPLSFPPATGPQAPRNDYQAPGGSTFGNNSYQPRPAFPGEAPRGGFLRNMAGGLAGGFLGSMMFNSVGRAMGGGSPGMGGGGGGGMGMIDILLLAGLGYLLFRWWRSRQQLNTAPANRDSVVNFRMPQDDSAPLANGETALAGGPTLDADQATDLFFRVQGAWTRRDLTSVSNLIGSDVAKELEKDLNELKTNKQINRLENISVRGVDIGPSWSESGMNLVTVRFTANLLDYTVDEVSQQVVAGSDTTPIKFVEDWTFSQSIGRQEWQLAGIAQV